MEIFKGRPSNIAERTPREVRTYDFLDALGVEYIRADHGKCDTMEACREIDLALGTEICKNLFLCNRQKTNFYLLLMPGSKPFKTKELSSQLSISRLSFADEEDMLRLIDIHPGSVSVMGLINDAEGKVRLVIDEDVLKSEFFACHPCESTSSIRFNTQILVDTVIPALNHTPTIVSL